MASADVQAPTGSLPTFFTEGLQAAGGSTSPSEVEAVLNYFKDNEDGSPPAPTYVDKPQTYERPVAPQHVKITNIAGRESEFSLDKQGFQVYPNVAEEKDFTDDEHIKAVYYPETEQLLKDV
ncbi:hypothetical protein NUW58_g627 [Xylaria curta]|uniref:Uncharacterized protein n=1 Tax=Xylaria curta TaxID=42375 RepID=A0ACC1PRA4_9PEZI|nr:hypothetical protein NUW58_g627 [Xylaria curta]